MVKKLKKAPSKAVKLTSHPIWVRFGSGNDFGEDRGYPTEPKAKQAIIKELNAWVPWCKRHNNAGLEAIADAKDKASTMTFHIERQQIVCQFDERYAMKLVAEYWRAP